ncbi:phage gene 29 protein family protein [Nocardia sp. CA-128927]|uniref:phage gene 29 protein family protein n=1 Tax=Nocardia sp. CA-128927 TaxID=3239975 RepID=UPI003D959675
MFKTLENTDFDDPEDHFAAALMNVEGLGPAGVPIPPAWASIISKHLVECGYGFGPWLARRADQHGKIDVKDLPKQTKKLARPPRGPVTNWNPGSRWVPMDTPEPEAIVLPDVDTLTDQERVALLAMFRARGDISEPEVEINEARVLNS